MSTKPKKLRKLLTNQVPMYELNDDEPTMYFLDKEEIALRQFVELNKSIPVFPGAFRIVSFKLIIYFNF